MFTKILVPLDQSSLAEHALGMAVAIARECGAEIHLVLAREAFASDGYRQPSGPGEGAPRSTDRDYLDRMAGEIQTIANVRVSASLVTGTPAVAICERAEQIAADLIVMTSHGRTGFSRALMGSVADSLVRDSAIPVLMLRSMDGTQWQTQRLHLARRILVPLDGSAESMAILTPVVALARCSGGSVVLARVVAPVPASVQDVAATGLYPLAVADPDATQAVVDEAKRQLDEVARRLRDDGASDVIVDVVVGESAGKAILSIAEARRADLIAMASHGRGASRLLIGSVADKVLRGGHLPLLLYRPVGASAAAERVAKLIDHAAI